MNSILQATADILRSKKFKPALTEDGETLLVRCCGELLFWTTAVDTSNDGTTLTLVSRVAVKVPPVKRAACAKLLARFNYGKRLGAFQMDLRDGEVHFCISSVLAAGIASEDALDTLFSATFSAMNKDAPEIYQLACGRGLASDSEAAATSHSRNRSLNPPDTTN